MDSVHTSADDLFLALMCGGFNAGADSAYAVLVDRNEVALMKWRDGGNLTILFWETLQIEFENVTVRLALRKTESGVVITAKVVDKVAAVTLYEKSFTDGAGQDAPVPLPDPHMMGIWTVDEGAPYTNFGYAGVGNDLIVRPVYLTNPQAAVRERRKTGTMFQQGFVGLWVQAKSPSYAFTLDNFFATGKKP